MFCMSFIFKFRAQLWEQHPVSANSSKKDPFHFMVFFFSAEFGEKGKTMKITEW